jgi:hypothetical protein
MAEITKPDFTSLWASGGDTVTPSSTKIQTGWEVEVPPRQWFNWFMNRVDTAFAYLFQHGIPTYDKSVNYVAGGLSYVVGNDGNLYRSVAASGPATTVQDPTTDSAAKYWKPVGYSEADASKKFAPIASPTFTGDPKAPTPADGDNDTSLATTQFVQTLVNGTVYKNLASSDVTLTAAELGRGTIILQGTLTANVSVMFPISGTWTVFNRTAGNFKVTLKGGTTDAGIVLTQGRQSTFYSNSSWIMVGFNEATNLRLVGTPTADTAAVNTATSQLATTEFVQNQLTSYGIGAYSDFRGTVYADPAATPASIISAGHGMRSGFVNGGSNGLNVIPSGTTVYGSLTYNVQYKDTTALASCVRTFQTQQRIFTSYAIDANSWSGWWESANLASPAFTGTPTAPTAAVGTNNTQLANTAFVNTAVANAVSSKANSTSPTISNPTVTGSLNATGSMELGTISKVPYIDFHSGATEIDYDARILGLGGNGKVGAGNLDVIANNVNFSNSVTIPSATIGGLKPLLNGGVVYGGKLANGLMPNIAATATSDGKYDAQAPLVVSNNANTAASAIMSFLREGQYAINFGLDTDNVLKVGGWSMGNAAYTMWHSGNMAKNTASLGETGWWKCSDTGLIRQWGRVPNAIPTDGNVTITLPITFPNAMVGATVTSNKPVDPTNGSNFAAYNFSRSTFLIVQDATAGACTWEAWGY